MALFAGNIDDLKSLYTTELHYMLSMEQQITKALPKLAEHATDPKLKSALQTHLRETEQHVNRVEQILQKLTGSASEKKCDITAALITAGENTIKAANDDAVRDAGIIAAAQKVEHFEIASYGSARDWAKLLGETQAAQMLEQTLTEEKHADKVLTEVAHERNPEALRAA